MSNTAVSINELTVAYGTDPVLWRVSIQIPQGVMMAIAGPNGAGKSTLLQTVVQLIQPVAGTIAIFGQPYNTVMHKVAYIRQRSTIDWNFPIDVLNVVLMGTYRHLRWYQRPGIKERHRALAALDAVGMYDYADTPINQLSGGQQQRMFIARALAQQADLYLMDEPCAGIDAATETLILNLMKDLTQQGKTIIIVHHDLHTITTHFDWALLLNRHPIAYGTRVNVITRTNVQQCYGPSMQSYTLDEHQL